MSRVSDRAHGAKLKRNIAGVPIAALAALALALSPASAFAGAQTGSAYCNADLVMRAASADPDYGTNEWVVYYTTVAKMVGSKAVPDGSRWQGPFYQHTNYPGWIWTPAKGWQLAQGSLPWPGQTFFQLQRGTGYYRGYQWVKYLGRNIVYEGTMQSYGCNTNV
jgi:hypothetical protein